MQPISAKRHDGSEFMKIYEIEPKEYLLQYWEGPFGTQENFKSALSLIADYVEKSKYKRMLSDHRNMIGSFISSEKWIAENIIPRFLSAHLKAIAVVNPDDVFSKISANEIIARINQMEIKQFASFDEAEKWLLTK